MTRPDAALLALRLALAAVLVNHGAWMLQRAERWSGVLEALALPGALLVPLAALEIVTGILVALGVGTRTAAALVAPWLLWWGALARPLGAPVGHGLPLVELAALAALVVAGPGRFAVLAARARRSEAAAPFAFWPLRVVVGVLLVLYSGLDKFARFDEWVGIFGDLGIPAPTVALALVATAELFGGVGLVLGVLTRFTSVVMLVVLGVAVPLAWWPLPMGAGWDFDVLLAGVFVALVLAGPGRPTPGSILGRDWRDPEELLVAAGRP